MPKACSKLVEVGRVRFQKHKACRKVAEVGRVRFDHLKTCMRLVEVQRAGGFYHRNAYEIC